MLLPERALNSALRGLQAKLGLTAHLARRSIYLFFSYRWSLCIQLLLRTECSSLHFLSEHLVLSTRFQTCWEISQRCWNSPFWNLMCRGKSVQAADSPARNLSVLEAYKTRVAGFPSEVMTTEWQCNLREVVSHSYRSLKYTWHWPLAPAFHPFFLLCWWVW